MIVKTQSSAVLRKAALLNWSQESFGMDGNKIHAFCFGGSLSTPIPMSATLSSLTLLS